jgi:hypothetical protein
MARKKTIFIFDNEGKTADRYTGIIAKTGDIIGFNSHPQHPAYGFGQFCGNVIDKLNEKFGYNWQESRSEKTIQRILNNEINCYVSEARKNTNWLGKEINVKDLSDNAKEFVTYWLSDEN